MLTVVDDASGETIELIVTQQNHRDMMSDAEDEEKQERSWTRRREPGKINLGSLVKVKGEIEEKWNIRRIQVMKLGILFCETVLMKTL